MKDKLYIFFATSICSIGGGQLYYRNKIRYLRSDGWMTYIFSFIEGEIEIDDLKTYKLGIIPDLKYPPYFYSNKKQNMLIEKLEILSLMKKYSSIVIESNNTKTSLWGEIVAKRNKAKHIIYALNENDKIADSNYFNFFKFKFERKEIAGIVNSLLVRFFEQYMKLDEKKSYSLSANSNNAITNVEDVEYDKSKILDDCITVLSLGRIEKPYLFPTLESFRNYAKENVQLNFNLVVVGGNLDNAIEEVRIKQLFDRLENVNLVLTGSLFPIPLGLIRRTDVCIASSGSAGLTYKFGIPTITIDGNDLLPIGILGYNANSWLFRNSTEPPQKLSDLLNLIIKERVIKNEFLIPQEFKIKADYSQHLNFIAQSASEFTYYDMEKFYNIKNRIIRLCVLMFGVKNCIYLRDVFRSVKMTIGNI